MLNIACKSVLPRERFRIPLCILNSCKWRTCTTKNEVTKKPQNRVPQQRLQREDIPMFRPKGERLYEMGKLVKPKRRDRVNLSQSKGISVEHIKKPNEHSALLEQCLDENPDDYKEGFFKAVDIFKNKGKIIRKGHIDFICTSLKFIDHYGLEKDPDVWARLMDVFPRDIFVTRTLFDAIAPKMYPQTLLALDILARMESAHVYPTEEMHVFVYEIFGRASMPLKKLYRLWFWWDNMDDINPYELDESVYLDRLNIIKAAIDRILGNNDGTKIVEISAPIEHKDLGVIDYDHFLISSQTLLQRRYMDMCHSGGSVYIEGPLFIWVNRAMEEYFIMKTGQGELANTEEAPIPEDEEREGVVIGICFATRPYKETLQRWLAYMQEENPALKKVNVVFDVSDDVPEEEMKSISPD